MDCFCYQFMFSSVGICLKVPPHGQFVPVAPQGHTIEACAVAVIKED